jgi:mannose-6-phosphate isomerase-like protein (cupin superfamily)
MAADDSLPPSNAEVAMSEDDVGLASVLGRWDTRRQRAAKGAILIKGSEQAWELNRQGRCKFYAHLGRTDLANPDWISFRHEIHTHSGMHVHQGGLALFVTKGYGYTICNGRRADWKEGDVILLPIEPGGVEHQHFNLGDEPCEWIAFAFNPWLDAMGNGYEQRENHPEYQPEEERTEGQ